MDSFGANLKAAREASGLTLQQVHEETLIARRFLEAIEQSDLSRLPGRAFDLGYIRTYAKLLRIDPAPCVRSYLAARARMGFETADADRAMIEEFSRLAGRYGTGGVRERKWPRLLMVSFSILAAAMALWFWLGTRTDKSSEASGGTPSVSDVAKTPARAGSSRPTRPPIDREQAERRDSDEAFQRVVSNLSPPAADLATEPIDEGVRKGSSETLSPLRVAEYGVGTEVVNRQLQGMSDRFVEGSRVLFWTRVTGGASEDFVRHKWRFQGREVMNARLRIGGAHWRTHSSFLLPSGFHGEWTVIAEGPDGHELASVRFVCVEAPASGRPESPAAGTSSAVAAGEAAKDLEAEVGRE